MKNYKKKEATQQNKNLKKLKQKLLQYFTHRIQQFQIYIFTSVSNYLFLFLPYTFFFIVVTSHVRSFHGTAYSIADGWKTDKWLYFVFIQMLK